MATQDPDALVKRPLYGHSTPAARRLTSPLTPQTVYDLPPEILASLQLKIDTVPHLSEPSEPTPWVSRPKSPIPPAEHEGEGPQYGGATKAVACTLCGMSFSNVQEQRSHARSDLHGYNLKQKLRGFAVVNENAFEKLVDDLNESISGSGSDSDDSDTESEEEDGIKTKGVGTMLSSLLKRQANIGTMEVEDITRKRKRVSGNPPLTWFTSPTLPSNTSLGVYRAIFTAAEQIDPGKLVEVLRRKQLAPAAPLKRLADEGGVPLSQAYSSPHIFMCMMGGGHFAGMIVSLMPKVGKKHGFDERQATIVAHKTFHRYTTRRKQGGSQATNDAAKGAAHSAGSSLRRYNEMALEQDIRQLLKEWKDMINTSELIFLRATGTTSRRTLFGPYEGQLLRQDDPRNRGFPFSTRRATQAELMRCFVELTRVKISQIDEAALLADRAKEAAAAEAQKKAAAAKIKAVEAKALPSKNPEQEVALLHTTQIEALIRRSKAPALLSYITTNALSPDFLLFPHDSQAHHHAPTPLHLASSTNSAALVNTLLVKGGADPTVKSPEGKTAFEIAGDRGTRDAFRLARSELGESKWAWEDAHVPEPLSKIDVDSRMERKRVEEAAKEDMRRKAEVERIRAEDKKKEDEKSKGVDDRRVKKMGKGTLLAGREMTAEERREEEARGMTPEMKMRLEREKRARAAEERMKRMAGGAGAGR